LTLNDVRPARLSLDKAPQTQKIEVKFQLNFRSSERDRIPGGLNLFFIFKGEGDKEEEKRPIRARQWPRSYENNSTGAASDNDTTKWQVEMLSPFLNLIFFSIQFNVLFV
jgi:hypothetical protein